MTGLATVMTVVQMVLVPGGEYFPGEPITNIYGEGDSCEWHDRSRPNYARTFVRPFLIDELPVTNAQYELFSKATGHPQTRFAKDPRLNGANHPVVGVSWEDSKAYCEWAHKRLPNEIEWEVAARGRTTHRYPWGDQRPNEGGFRANFGADPKFDADGFLYTAPVGSFAVNRSPYGMKDVVGNVWQWTSSWFECGRYRHANEPAKGVDKVLKGGSWSNSAWTLRVTTRLGMRPEATEPGVGFRCAKDAKP